MNNILKYKVERENLYLELGSVCSTIVKKELNVDRNFDNETVQRYWEIHREIANLS